MFLGCLHQSIYGAVGIVLNALTLAEESDEDGSPWPINHRPVLGVLTIIQSFFLVSLIFGILGIWKRERNFYFTACFIILGIFATLLVFGIVCIRTSQKDMTSDMFKFLKKNQRRNESIAWFLDIQLKHKCCGVSSYTDWIILNQDGNLKPLDSVPTSCCFRKIPTPGKTCGHNILSSNKTKEQIKKEGIIYTEPCNSKITSVVREKSMTSGMEMIIVALACLLIAAFLYCGATEMFCLRGQFGRRSTDSTHAIDTTRSVRFDSFDTESLGKCVSNTRGVRLNSRGELEGHHRSRHSKQSNTELNPNTKRNNVSFLATTESGTPIKAKSNKGRPNKPSQPLKKNLIGIKEQGMNTANNNVISNNITTNNNINNNYQEIRRVSSKHPIECRKAQIRRPNRTSWKWKGNSRVDSKALILGEQRQRIGQESKLTFPPKDDMIRKQLEMLYDGVDKNVSTLSTTPNPSGTLSFPWSLMNKTVTASSPPPPGGNNIKTKSPPDTKENNPKRLCPSISLSHYSSLPLFHLVKFPNGELGTLGQYSPHLVSNRHERHNHRYFYTPPPPSAFGSPVPNSGARRSNITPLSTAAVAAELSNAILRESQPQRSVIFTEGNNVGGTDEDLGGGGGGCNPSSVKISISGLLEPQENNNVRKNPSVYPSLVSPSISTTPRASTLETIEEECESIKSIPQGATPASLSPTGEGSETSNNMFGGNFIVNNISSNNAMLTITSSQINILEPILSSVSDCGETYANNLVQSEDELIKPLKPVGTGEFIVGSTISATDNKEEEEGGNVGTTLLPIPDGVILNEYQNQPSKPIEFETEQRDMIEETISDIGALAKARASTAQVPLGFN